MIWIGFASLLGLALLGNAFLFWFLAKKQKPNESPFLVLQQSLDNLRGDFLKSLEQSKQGLDLRLDNAAKVFIGLESRMVRMEEVSRQVLDVSKDISSLQQILKAPKLRGGFGEELLGNLLVQMLPQENYVLQHTFKNGERVDAVIKTAQGLVPVDSKFPLENFSHYLETSDEEKKNAFRKNFVSDVKKHINDIAAKYIRPSEKTFDFALMYIPAENVYYEIITRDLAAGEEASIATFALKKKVIPVSPNTLYAYLQTILLGLRGMQVEKRVKEIVIELARLRKELNFFREDFSKLGKHLRDSEGSFEAAEKHLNRLESRLAGLDVAPREVLPEKEALLLEEGFKEKSSAESIPLGS